MYSSTNTYRQKANSKDLLRLLAYFDIFKHPLQQKEMEQMLAQPLGDILNELCCNDVLHCIDGFYMLEKNEEWLRQRLDKNSRASKYQKKIKQISKIIRLFPFTRSICISGSLSKGVMEKDGDIDFFIMAANNRIWLNRTMLILFKKIFLFNSKKYFCVNYFIDEKMLLIPDQNIFTAMEIWHLMPVYNQDIYNAFMEENRWISNYFPKTPKREVLISESKPAVFTRSMECILSGRLGNWLDDFCFRYTVKHWTKKFGNYDAESYELVFRSEKSVSKHHPNNFQKKVLEALEMRMQKYQENFHKAFEEISRKQVQVNSKSTSSLTEDSPMI